MERDKWKEMGKKTERINE